MSILHNRLEYIYKLINSFRKLSIRKQNISKLKKCNLPCKIYQKYGKCAKMERGKCLKLHNPDQIALCAKYTI